MNFTELSEGRFSVRKFSPRPVEQEKLEAILQAGRAAPTACNRQPQRVLAIQSPAALETLQKCSVHHFGETLALLVCYDKTECWTRGYDGKDSGETDAAIVATHMMLAAWELGIGSTWIMHFIPRAVQTEFHLPDHVEPAALLLMGYPAEDCRPSPMHGSRKELGETVTFL